jgi:hypothetical protein
METVTSQFANSEAGGEALPENLRVVEKPTTPTRGEKAVHGVAHLLVNFLGNYTLSIGIIDLFLGSKKQANHPSSFIAEISANKGEWGKKVVDFSDWCYNKKQQLQSGVNRALPNALDAEINKKIAETAADVFTLMLGGHFTAAATAYIVNRQDKLAKRFDKWLDVIGGCKPSEEVLAEREARYEVLREAPKKTVGQVVTGRILGYLMNLGSTTATNYMDLRLRTDGVKDDLKNNNSKTGIRAITQGIGNSISGYLIQNKPNLNEDRVRYWSELGLYEVFCTMNTKTALEIVFDHGKKKQPATVSVSPSANDMRYHTDIATESPPLQEQAASAGHAAKHKRGGASEAAARFASIHGKKTAENDAEFLTRARG